MEGYKKYWSKCTLYDKQRVPDGAGGTIDEYQPSRPFDCYVGMNRSVETQRAAGISAVDAFICETDRDFPIVHNDYFKWDEKQMYLRVDNNPQDSESDNILTKSFTAIAVDKLP